LYIVKGIRIWLEKYCEKLSNDGVLNRCKILSNKNIAKMTFANWFLLLF
jgi:hypothetical protein